MRRIVCVVPTIRPESHAEFVAAWTPLFEKHKVTLVTVWDGEDPNVDTIHFDGTTDDMPPVPMSVFVGDKHKDLFCRYTDACRNLGFVAAAMMDPTHVLTLDDDCYPLSVPCPTCTGGTHGAVTVGDKTYTRCVHKGQLEETRRDGAFRNVPCPTCDGTAETTNDPIQAHLDALDRRVSLSWMNTAHDTDLYLRGVPYGVRDEAPVMLSHGVWVGTPDFDGETQLRLEGKIDPPGIESAVPGVPHSLPYYVGPIPRGVNFPLCGMNVMVKRDALPYLYFAPMGPDTGVFTEREVDQTAGGTHTFKIPTLNRFADIWMGVFLKREFDKLGWACVTGYSTIHHTRASDARKNFEQEKLGREWNEYIWRMGTPRDVDVASRLQEYLLSYADKRARYAELVTTLLGASGTAEKPHSP